MNIQNYYFYLANIMILGLYEILFFKCLRRDKLHNNQFQLYSCKRTIGKGRKKRVEDTFCISAHRLACQKLKPQRKQRKVKKKSKQKYDLEKLLMFLRVLMSQFSFHGLDSPDRSHLSSHTLVWDPRDKLMLSTTYF